jgi:hypothetical protein
MCPDIINVLFLTQALFLAKIGIKFFKGTLSHNKKTYLTYYFTTAIKMQ